jgi:hypothetical protein
MRWTEKLWHGGWLKGSFQTAASMEDPKNWKMYRLFLCPTLISDLCTGLLQFLGAFGSGRSEQSVVDRFRKIDIIHPFRSGLFRLA